MSTFGRHAVSAKSSCPIFGTLSVLDGVSCMFSGQEDNDEATCSDSVAHIPQNTENNTLLVYNIQLLDVDQLKWTTV